MASHKVTIIKILCRCKNLKLLFFKIVRGFLTIRKIIEVFCGKKLFGEFIFIDFSHETNRKFEKKYFEWFDDVNDEILNEPDTDGYASVIDENDKKEYMKISCAFGLYIAKCVHKQLKYKI